MKSADASNRLLAIGCTGVVLVLLMAVLGMVYVERSAASAVKRPFELVDTRGRTVDQRIFEGRPSLVYFGYTNCPEVCPTTMVEMVDWLNALGPAGDDIQPLFFTIDPARDTLDVMKAYVAAFSDRIVGVTGSEEEMRKASGSLLVHARRDSDGNRYAMRHTTSLLMIGVNGRLQGLIPYGTPREEAINTIRSVLLRSKVAAAL